jgi:hypothetical protein
MRCRACNGISNGSMLTDVSVNVAIASMNDNRCPHCGAGIKKLSLGQNRTVAEDDACRRQSPGASVANRASDWLATGEVGLASGSIHKHMTGKGGEIMHPRDVADLHRCMLLLRRIPEWEARIDEMAPRSAGWRAVAGVWPQLSASFREEAGPDLAAWPRPKTGEILRAALENVEG